MTLTPHLTHMLLIGVVGVLSAWQIPLDVRRRVLSRRATGSATFAVLVVMVVDLSVTRQIERARMAFIWSLAVGGLYLSLNRVSPKSLGFGDVLLVVPLTLAVSYVAGEYVLMWQLLAAGSAATHGLVVRVTRGMSLIPFGPHLLGAAWLVLVFSL